MTILKRAVQSVVIIFKVLQLQEVSGPLAALLRCRREVGALSWRGAAAGRLLAAGQVFGCRLVLLLLLAGRASAERTDAGNNKGKQQRQRRIINIP